MLSTLKITKMNTGNAKLAKIELRDTKRVRKRTKRKTPEQLSAVQGDTAMINPKSVATPLPPLNSAQMEKYVPKLQPIPILSENWSIQIHSDDKKEGAAPF